MGRTLSLLAHLPRLEADGVTHRRDCECVRCDAGFRPTEQERERAHEKWEQRKAEQEAARLLARRQARARLKRVALELELKEEGRQVDTRLAQLRAARARADQDARLAMFERLVRAGMSLSEALRQVERAFPGAAASPANEVGIDRSDA